MTKIDKSFSDKCDELIKNLPILKEPQKMTDSELDEAIAIEVMGWHLVDSNGILMWEEEEVYARSINRACYHPSTNLNQCWEAEEKIKDLGLSIQYIRILYGFLQNSNRTLVFDFDIFHATARQRCEAMLAAVRGAK